jgi:hypothetical protein
VEDPSLREERRFQLANDALEFVAELWPRPRYGTVMIETHQWQRLRRLLLAIPEELLDGQGIAGRSPEARSS